MLFSDSLLAGRAACPIIESALGTSYSCAGCPVGMMCCLRGVGVLGVVVLE